MAISPDDFASTAEALVHGQAEVDWRNSASRSFYGALHAASRFLSCLGVPDPNSNFRMGTHERVSEWLKALPAQSSGKSMAYVLEDMKRRRVVADYELEQLFPQQEASQQLATAKRMAEKLRTLAANESVKA